MRRSILTLAAILLLAAPALGQQVPSTDSAKTFVGTQYFHIIDGPDHGHNLARVIAGVRIAGEGKSTRWYFGADMSDQQAPKGQGGWGPALIMVSDIAWFEHRGQPVVSIVASLSWVDAAKFDSESKEFTWGPWTTIGPMFHLSDAAKLTVGFSGSPAASGFIENVGVGPGLFVTDPEQRLKDIAAGAYRIAEGIVSGILGK